MYLNYLFDVCRKTGKSSVLSAQILYPRLALLALYRKLGFCEMTVGDRPIGNIDNK